jgi:hypothetical protein
VIREFGYECNSKIKVFIISVDMWSALCTVALKLVMNCSKVLFADLVPVSFGSE